MRFALFSNNRKKLEELRSKLSSLGIEFVLVRDLGHDIDPEETGLTFEENALIKARAGMKATGIPCIADDSGLCVDALGGAPGVLSARFGAPETKTDSDRTSLLLKTMEKEENRGARFVSVIACVFPDGTEITARGECAGEITREARGNGGFGYDPVFYLSEYGQTMAEIPASLKAEISHRALAMNALKNRLSSMRQRII